MKLRPRMLVPTLAAAALPWAACSEGAGKSAGGTGARTTSHMTMPGSGGADCQAILPAGPCADCLTGSCCAELAGCNNDPGSCLDCFQGNVAGEPCTDPTTAPLLAGLTTCRDTRCPSACATPDPSPDPACDAPAQAPSQGACSSVPAGGCNPVTGAGCPGPGQTCDLGSSGFQCFTPPPANTAATCAACGASLQCAPGNTCLASGRCGRYCCDDGDCGAGICDRTLTMDPYVGVCVHPHGDGG